MQPPPDAAWQGWMRSVTLCAPDPASALEHWAEILGCTATDGVVQLGSGTALHVERGEPGFSSLTLETLHDGDRTATDPDGRKLKLVATEEVALRPDVAGARLGHVTFESPDPMRLERFYESLGFELSEGLETNFRWLRCNPIHHTVAFARSEAARLHHVGIELPDRSALIDACDRLAALGHRIEYGPGRHFVGNNIFLYFVDQHGIRFEFFCELERIKSTKRKPLIHSGIPRHRSINLWGPQPPEDYFRGV